MKYVWILNQQGWVDVVKGQLEVIKLKWWHWGEWVYVD